MQGYVSPRRVLNQDLAPGSPVKSRMRLGVDGAQPAEEAPKGPPEVDPIAWDRSCPLNETQGSSIEALLQACAERPLPSHVTERVAGEEEASSQQQQHATARSSSGVGAPRLAKEKSSKDRSGSGGKRDAVSVDRAVLRETAQFYEWHSELMEQQGVLRSEQYQQYGKLLESYCTVFDGLLGQIDAVLADFESLGKQQQTARRRVVALLDGYRQIELEQEALQKVVDSLQAKLAMLLTAAGAPPAAAAAAAARPPTPQHHPRTARSPRRSNSYDAFGPADSPFASRSSPRRSSQLSLQQQQQQRQPGLVSSQQQQQQQQQGDAAADDSLSGWLSSTLGVDANSWKIW